MSRLKKKFRQVKKLPWWLYVLPVLLIKAVRFCMRTEIRDPNDHIYREDSVITVTWHNRILFFPPLFPPVARKKCLAVVSPSRDGQYVTDFIARFGIGSLRGSSKKRGAPVLREAVKALENGHHVVFTPDGSRGPKYVMSKGPVHLASVSGRPVLPISINASSYWELNTWDNFQIPKPWAKLTLILGDEIKVPPDLDDEGIEKWRKIIEDKLMEITADKA